MFLIRKWKKLYEEIPSMEDHQVVIGLSRIVSLFKYGHTGVGYRYRQLPLNLYHFSDGVFIQGVHKDHGKCYWCQSIGY